MQKRLLDILRCPVCKSELRLEIIEQTNRSYQNKTVEEIITGILYAENGFFYPIIDGVPRLLVESFSDYADFFKVHLKDYETKRKVLLQSFPSFIRYVQQKNYRIKQSFSLEWKNS